MTFSSDVIVLLTDFGIEDPYVGMMKGVILSICPKVKIIDLTHNVRSFDVEHGAFILYVSYKYFPRGTIFVCVVDPGVGSSRRPIAILTNNYIFIGPDNGLMVMAAEDDGIRKVFLIENQKLFRTPISRSFHGRDIFAPVAAHIACGIPIESIGREINPNTLVRLDIRKHIRKIKENCVELKILAIDKFGNNILSSRIRDILDLLNIDLNSTVTIYSKCRSYRAIVGETFSIYQEGTLVLYENSFWLAELAVNRGSAKEILCTEPGDTILICREL